VVRVGLTDNSSVVKSPTSVASVPTLVLAPARLSRSSSRSGKTPPPVGTRVQKERVSPLARFSSGVSIQLLMVPTPAVLLKLAPM
jgi:hypothetical protein